MKYFIVYKDLVVRECLKIVEDINVDLVGIIEGEETKKSFKPNYFSKAKDGAAVALWEWKIQNNYFQLNNYFKVTKIKEQPDSKASRTYYKEIVIRISDVFDTTIDFTFHLKPETELTYKNFQKFFKDIIEKLDTVESAGMYNLLNECKDKDSKIEKLEKRCLSLEDSKKELIEEVKKFKDDLKKD